jgi:hypothetical protein
MTDDTTSDSGESQVEKPHRPGTFSKGYDPRRNLRGTPPDAITARKMLRKIAAELVALKDGGGEGDVTRLYLMLRQMLSSRNPRHNEIVLKALFPGLLKDELDLTSGGKALEVHFDYSKLVGGHTPPGPDADSEAPGANESNLHGPALGKDGDGGALGD